MLTLKTSDILDLNLVWVAQVDLISVWRTELDLIPVYD